MMKVAVMMVIMDVLLFFIFPFFLNFCPVVNLTSFLHCEANFVLKTVTDFGCANHNTQLAFPSTVAIFSRFCCRF
jgi:hypothetical protein